MYRIMAYDIIPFKRGGGIFVKCTVVLFWLFYTAEALWGSMTMILKNNTVRAIFSATVLILLPHRHHKKFTEEKPCQHAHTINESQADALPKAKSVTSYKKK